MLVECAPFGGPLLPARPGGAPWNKRRGDLPTGPGSGPPVGGAGPVSKGPPCLGEPSPDSLQNTPEKRPKSP